MFRKEEPMNKTCLYCICERMAKVKTARHIWRRENDDKFLACRLHRGLEKARLLPPRVPAFQKSEKILQQRTS